MIYEPQEDSFLLQKWVKKLAKGIVLDIGTGSGIQALTAVEKQNTKQIIAVDIDKEAIEYCKKKTDTKKIKFIVSDLFENVKGEFDTIIFNPPYLPQATNTQKELALEGGRKGYEIIEQFLLNVSSHLKQNGIILTVFSSFTNKQKVNEIIEKNLFEAKELEKQHIFFEELYAYQIKKSDSLGELEKKNLKKIKYFAKGKRGMIFTAKFRGKKVAIKIKQKETKAQNIIENEAKMLMRLEKYKFSTKFLFKNKNYLVYEFIEGEYLKNWIKKTSIKNAKDVLIKIINICRLLDTLGINKEEMHHPWKHVIIRKSDVKFIDFERAHFTQNPHNVTQFLNCTTVILHSLKSSFDKEHLILLSKTYKKNQSDENFMEILNWVKNV